MTGSWRDVMLSKCVSRLDLWKYYSLYGGMWNLFCRVEHYPLFELFCGISGGGTRLAMPETTLRAGLVVIETWFRGY